VADPVLRGAARWATLVAVPLALLAGIGTFVLLDGTGSGSDAPDASGSPGPDRAVASATPAATGAVTVTAPALPARARTVCRALVSQLPAALRDRPPRPVTAGSEQNAAYGEPPITVACGVPPATFPPTDIVYALDRVCWHAARGTDGGSVWTTVDREVPVRVAMPAAYEQPGQWVIELSAPVIATVPTVPADRIPTGCNP
jgi:hypothetical protein